MTTGPPIQIHPPPRRLILWRGQLLASILPTMLSSKIIMARRITSGISRVATPGLYSTIRYSSALSSHRDSPKDNPSIPFEFTPENILRAKSIISKYPENYKRSAVMPLLDLGQRQHGFTSISVMNYVAKLLSIPPMRVYEVATFYSMYNRQPMGKYHIQICTTTPCALRDAESIKDAIINHLGVEIGQTTKDNLFTISEVECLGACINAPMIAINDDYFEDLTVDKTKELLNDLKNGKKINPGPVSGRRDCEPISGQKVLLQKEPWSGPQVTRSDL